MARQETTTVECDFCPEPNPDAKTILFSAYGRDYEVDACPAHAAWIFELLGQLIEKARRTGKPKRQKRTEASRAEDAGIRARAIAAGEPIMPNGRLPKAIRDKYAA